MRWLLCSVIVGVFVAGCGSSERVFRDTFGESAQFSVVTTSIPAPSGDEAALKEFVVVPYSTLKFVSKKGGMREAVFTIESHLYFGDKEVALATVEEEHIVVRTFRETTDLSLASTQELYFTGTPAVYRLETILIDHNRSRGGMQKIEDTVTLRPLFPAGIEVGDPIIVESYEIDPATDSISILPANHELVSWDPVQFITVAYLPNEITHPATITFHYEVYGNESTVIARGSSDPRVCTKPWSYYAGAFSISDSVPPGTYTISVYAERESGERSPRATKQFEFVPLTPRTSEEFDRAADDMQYLSRTAEFKEVSERVHAAKTLEEKQDVFISFWEFQGPTKAYGLAKMRTFLYRVQRAHKRFSNPMNDDRFGVYIALGVPTSRDATNGISLRSESALVTETWYYESSEKHQVFFFVQDRWGNYGLKKVMDNLKDFPLGQ